MIRPTLRLVIGAMVALALSATSASAQVFGTFAWQMQPYCNVVTLTITQFPGGYTLDGSDNQCGAATVASATGQVHINPNGTVGVNFAIITAPAGKAVHVAAVLSPANGSGTWTDSVGNSGTFALGATVAARRGRCRRAVLGPRWSRPPRSRLVLWGLPISTPRRFRPACRARARRGRP